MDGPGRGKGNCENNDSKYLRVGIVLVAGNAIENTKERNGV